MQEKGPGPDTGRIPLTPEQMDRFAALIATGEAEFPGGLSREQEEELTGEVRTRLRRRLVHLIAHRIALDIRSEPRSPLKDTRP